MQTYQTQFKLSHVLRDAPLTDKVTKTTNGVYIGVVRVPDGQTSRDLAALLDAGIQLDVRTLCEMTVSGVFSALRVNGNKLSIWDPTLPMPGGRRGAQRPFEGVRVEVQRMLRSKYLAAQPQQRGKTLVIANGAGRMRGILNGQDSYRIEGLAERLVRSGAYYPCFVATKYQGPRDNPTEWVFLVPLYFDEMQYDEQQAGQVFQNLSEVAVGQAMQYAHARQVEAVAAAAAAQAAAKQVEVEDDALAALKAGGSITLGFG